MICKKCGKEMDNGAVMCTNCGNMLKKKPLYKKWWFWVLIVLAVIVISAIGGGDSSEDSSSKTDGTSQSASSSEKQEIVYEKTDLQTMFDELSANALKAEKTYQDKYVEVTGKIYNFDSDGEYISIKPTGADEWDFESAMCYIENDDQLNLLLEKNKGDTVTIKGQVTSIGEVLGYSIDIAEVS